MVGSGLESWVLQEPKLEGGSNGMEADEGQSHLGMSKHMLSSRLVFRPAVLSDRERGRQAGKQSKPAGRCSRRGGLGDAKSWDTERPRTGERFLSPWWLAAGITGMVPTLIGCVSRGHPRTIHPWRLSLLTGAPSPEIRGGNAQPGWVVCIFLPPSRRLDGWRVGGS